MIVLVLESIGAAVAVGSLLAAVLASAKAQGVKQSLELLATANEALRLANADATAETKEATAEAARERDAMRLEFAGQLHKQELDCAREISELKGQVQVLTGSLAERIVVAVAGALIKQKEIPS